MNEILVVLGVAGLFLLRIGLPVMFLVGLGILVDRWQSQRDKEAQTLPLNVIDLKRQAVEEEAQEQKAA